MILRERLAQQTVWPILIRNSLAGVQARDDSMLLIGYFEGISLQRGIAWRCSDSRSLAEFLGYAATQETPDHSSLTRAHQRLPLEVHQEVFRFVLKLADDKKLIAGKTVLVDSSTLEANAAMKSIERKDTGRTGIRI
jgi:hypothetical protein